MPAPEGPLTDVIEAAASGRAKCRGCQKPIAKASLRFGERGPNPMGDGEATYWFHLQCAAYRRPETFLAALEQAEGVDQREALHAVATEGLLHPRLPRLARAERDPSGRARCRHCKAVIERGAWRLVLQVWEEGRFGPIGFIHVRCARPYFEEDDLLPRIRHFTHSLAEDDLSEIAAALATPPPATNESTG